MAYEKPEEATNFKKGGDPDEDPKPNPDGLGDAYDLGEVEDNEEN